MKVRLLKRLSLPQGLAAPGTVIDLTDGVAKDFITKGLATKDLGEKHIKELYNIKEEKLNYETKAKKKTKG